jgi:hypothetical protein
MAPRLTAVLLLVALFTSCSTSRAVRLDTGQGAPREYRPPASNTSGHVDAESFEQTLNLLMLEAPLPLRSSQQGSLVLASYPGHDMHAGWQRLMSRSFGGFCKPAQRRDDCLSVLDDVMGLSPWDKLGVSLALSLDPQPPTPSPSSPRPQPPSPLCCWSAWVWTPSWSWWMPAGSSSAPPTRPPPSKSCSRPLSASPTELARKSLVSSSRGSHRLRGHQRSPRAPRRYRDEVQGGVALLSSRRCP